MIDTGHLLIGTNIGVIITVFALTVRLTWFLAKLDAKIDRVDNKADRSHERLDSLVKAINHLERGPKAHLE
jgi:hypothetical protein